ncbi:MULTISPECIES: hypothetical protein [Rhizobium]|uniref:Uncharacterized protein n=1 Tax=Rhizobium leguminosarum bv. viciae TaxID=387 RepID=A0A8G2MPQ0_RHILV|nr:hypothetical protein [Rhizobium leguminosarum]NEI02845.1 hypothetical protein [Rhizobium leguminosarum]NKK10869.1 hypothetical protein [Rhizobium leguminosarum bv. viciae]NKK24335.1 hypothetical protein [Rhizobium leguminosarum bv. viciae]TBX86668.1 hypothetical protein E0H31_31295 [Rhizobium leguminosarum bv. viciae]TBZ11624.1 hypothetical protein E0H52_31055 [Rhizobium leguminosarum bv. viciae]
MSSSSGEKHPFLDDLADDAELRGTVLRRPVSGRDNIKRLVEVVGTLYASQTPTFYGAIDQRHVLQYQATLRTGLDLEAVGVIERDETGLVQRVTMTFAPLDAAVSLSAELGGIVGEEFGGDLFFDASVNEIAAS